MFDNTLTHLCPISRLFRKCSFQGPNYRLSNKLLKLREKGILKKLHNITTINPQILDLEGD